MIEKFILDQIFLTSLKSAKESEQESLKREAFLSSNSFDKEEGKESFLKGKEKRIKEEFKTFFKEELLKNAKR